MSGAFVSSVITCNLFYIFFVQRMITMPAHIPEVLIPMNEPNVNWQLGLVIVKLEM